jgi:seryl-tRNA(Sec) selenium transferase
MHDLMEAKKALQEFERRADLDAIAKTKLTLIANALGEAEQRLKALEEVVEELAAGAKLETVRSDSHYVAKLLGRHRTEKS